MTFELGQPWALALLALLPGFWLLSRYSRTYLPARRRRLALGMRLAVAILLIAAAASPRVIGRADRQAVAFLVDVSDSITPQLRERQLALLREAIAGMGERDLAAIIAFGDQSVVERPPSSSRQIQPISSVAGADKTDIGGAIRLALATLPTTMARKLVVLSDGTENVGKAIDQARIAGAINVPVSVIPLAAPPSAEVLVRRLETPAFVREGETFAATLTLDSNVDGAARVHLLADGRLIASQNVELTAGTNSVVLPQEPLPQGFHLFRVQIEGRDDTYVQNNEGGSYTFVTGKPRILVLEGESGETRYLAEALRTAGLDVDVRVADNAVVDLPTLRGYESVVLANVPAAQLNLQQMRAITTYVQSLGGGLLVIGGEKSYGVGRYNRTPLEEALPVRMDLRGRTLTASVALVLVIDASGSMAGGPGASKMELAKEAAIRAAELLSEQDQVGVLSFDDAFRWVVETQFISDPTAIQQQIGTINPGGGTAIFPALDAAYRDIQSREAKVKHIVLLTDGLSTGGDYDALTREMLVNNVTLSTVAVGSDADFALLRRLAELGRGRYFEGNDPFDVPQMLVKDTQEVARAAIVEEPFRPAPVSASPMLEGIDASKLPPLLGYVSTTPKPNSQVLLMSGQADPVLSEWQYGLGHVVAWTSDAKNRWAQDWLNWPDFSRFWSQVVKRTIPNPADRNLQVQITPEGGMARVTVDAVNDDKSFDNFLQTRATVVDPTNALREIPLPQVAPGRYEAKIPTALEGAYFVNIIQSDAVGGPTASPRANRPSGFVVGYSPEYQSLKPNPELLSQIARESGGRVLTDARGVFVLDQEVNGQPRDLWPWFLAAAAVLFIFDVAVRRLRLGWLDAQLAWRYALDRVFGRARQVAAPAASRLLAAKGRISVDAAARARAGQTAAGPSGPVGGRTQSSSALGARLLDAKRRARQE
ncbi:MAG: VWA domain-containing protein [Chloroflexota bacterium]